MGGKNKDNPGMPLICNYYYNHKNGGAYLVPCLYVARLYVGRHIASDLNDLQRFHKDECNKMITRHKALTCCVITKFPPIAALFICAAACFSHTLGSFMVCSSTSLSIEPLDASTER